MTGPAVQESLRKVEPGEVLGTVRVPIGTRGLLRDVCTLYQGRLPAHSPLADERFQIYVATMPGSEEPELAVAVERTRIHDSNVGIELLDLQSPLPDPGLIAGAVRVALELSNAPYGTISRDLTNVPEALLEQAGFLHDSHTGDMHVRAAA